MTRTQLDTEMAHALQQLALCSHARVPSYEPKGRSGATTSAVLQRDRSEFDHVYYAGRYGPPFAPATRWSARTDLDREGVLVRIRDEIRSHRGHGLALIVKPAGETLDELKTRIVKAGEGWTVQDCVNHFRCTATTVRAARREHGRDPDLGRLPVVVRLPAAQRQARALELAGRGLGHREIARALGEHHMTIHRDLARAAA